MVKYPLPFMLSVYSDVHCGRLFRKPSVVRILRQSNTACLNFGMFDKNLRLVTMLDIDRSRNLTLDIKHMTSRNLTLLNMRKSLLFKHRLTTCLALSSKTSISSSLIERTLCMSTSTHNFGCFNKCSVFAMASVNSKRSRTSRYDNISTSSSSGNASKP